MGGGVEADMRQWAYRVSVVGFVVVTAVGIPTAAYAPPPAVSIAYVSGDSLEYVDQWAADSQLVVRTSGVGYLLDQAYPVTAGASCSHPKPTDPTLVYCAGDISSMSFNLADGNDYLDLWESGTIGTGVSAGSGNDIILGNNGRQVVSAGPGDDYFSGEAGDDQINGGLGADLLFGGPGFDSAYYNDRTANLIVSLNAVVGDDGEPSEGDTVWWDFERVLGGAGNDQIHGNDLDNRLDGCTGNDTLLGYGGNDVFDAEDDGGCTGATGGDVIDGGPGIDEVTYGRRRAGIVVQLDGLANDGGPGEGDNLTNVERVRGSEADDTLVGSAGGEMLDGGPGNDFILGLDGEDILRGGPGDDGLYGGAGPDVLDGGDGFDFCSLGPDGLDTLDCE
jgi:Ca2+-binding RTX toxin-like protein